MSLSPSVENYLRQSNVPYDVIRHPESHSSVQTARSSHISPAELAKAVVVKSKNEYYMCVLPASNVLVLKWLEAKHKGHFHLVSEQELETIFPDCADGAIPPMGNLYGLNVICDRMLKYCRDVYFEAGDHRHVIHINKDEFAKIMETAEIGTISCTPDALEYFEHTH